MKSYESFDLWFADQKDSLQDLIKPVRRFIRKEFGKLEETVKWTNGCWAYKDLPIVYIHTEKNFIQIGFFAGSLLKDPKKRLEGKGKYIRYLIVREKKDFDREYTGKLIRQAIRIEYR
jgi:hypothetical protein